MPDPHVGDRREATPATNGVSFVPVHSAPQRRHAMVVAQFFESFQRRRLRWPILERTANGRRSIAGQHRYYCDLTKAWAGHVGWPWRPGAPHVSRHCHGTAREQSTQARKSSHPFGRGCIAPVAPPGTGCIRRRSLNELRRLLSCVLSIALPLRSTMFTETVRQKSLGCFIERKYDIHGVPATGRVTSRRIGRESAKRHPQFVHKVAN